MLPNNLNAPTSFVKRERLVFHINRIDATNNPQRRRIIEFQVRITSFNTSYQTYRKKETIRHI